MRRWGYEKKGVQNSAEIIAFEGNFHGRSTTIVGFSDEPEHARHFGPPTPGFRLAKFGSDVEIGPTTVGIGAHALGRLRAEVRGARDIRGRGLMMAVEYDEPIAHDLCERPARAGVLAKDTRRTVIRLMPPLVIPEDELDRALDVTIPILSR